MRRQPPASSLPGGPSGVGANMSERLSKPTCLIVASAAAAGCHPRGARYHALLIPDCPGAMTDLANSGYLARILQHFSSENKPICAVGHGVAALCCATNEDKSWVFQGYSLTGPSVYELIRLPNFASFPIIVEDFAKDSGASFTASKADAVHVVLDRHLVTGQNDNSTVAAVQNLVILCNGSRK